MTASRPEDARRSNERIAERADRLRFVSRVPMLCECSSPACQQIFLIELDRFDELRSGGALTVPGHAVDHHRPELKRDGYWRHVPAGS